VGNACEILPELFARGVRPDLLTDQTSAHDPVNGYLPRGWSLERWAGMREQDPAQVAEAAKASMAVHVRAMLDFQAAGVPTVDYGANIRQMAREAGVDNAFDFPGFVPAYIRPLFRRGIGPFRWVALSGDPEDIARTDAKVKELVSDDAHLHNWLDMAARKIRFQGLPARICWVGLGEGILQRAVRYATRASGVQFAQSGQMHHALARQGDAQFQRAAGGLDEPTQGREVQVGLALHLQHRGLGDPQALGDLILAALGEQAQRLEALDLGQQLGGTALDPDPAVLGQGGHDVFMSASHFQAPLMDFRWSM